MFVCCVMSGRGLCDELITSPEESYRIDMSSCVIKKPRGRGDHSPRWAAEPEGIIKLSTNFQDNYKALFYIRPHKVFIYFS
jgi:hypothetical protein